MKRILMLAVAAVAATTGAVVAAAPAQAAPVGCGSGYFCVYNDINYSYNSGLYRTAGSDVDWYDNRFPNGKLVARHDSSWFNNGITGPGIPSYTKVFEGKEHVGAMTICLRAGTGFPRKPASSDRGGSHLWAFGC
ncbi:peptidase inhibitor family I36 protein [Actinoplanes sp. NBC_00393]|uniref:peptidase inhibitor family I36 protein n=1 Tax=Actinoplanes sp. NBC_00393 TaxID=2975953 RepID=UPI002E1E75B4